MLSKVAGLFFCGSVVLSVSDDETDLDDLDDLDDFEVFDVFDVLEVLFADFSVDERGFSTVPTLSDALAVTVTLPDVQLPIIICCTSESTQSKTV